MEESSVEEAADHHQEKWQFGLNKVAAAASNRSIRVTLNKVISCVDQESGPRPVISLGQGDPSAFPSFCIAPTAEDALVATVRSAEYNGYGPSNGVLEARQAVAEHISRDLPYNLSPDDVFLTAGCAQAMEIVIAALAIPNANILLPRPGFQMYETRCTFSNLEMRHFDLVPEKGWEVDLDQVEKLADGNTVAIVVINPNNPCGSVFKYRHMEEVAKTAKKLGIMVIADEVYNHMTFGNNPFVPMGVFGDIAPVLTLGSISKRWVVPGWRFGWIIITDPKKILRKTKVVESIKSCLDITMEPATFMQGAIPHIIAKSTMDNFVNSIVRVLRDAAEICYNWIKDIKCLTCPHKPEASMFVMVKLNLPYLEDIFFFDRKVYLEDISDDVDFCSKLAKEESVILLPGKIEQVILS